jgi:phage terminase Nu1 subunit (DNA packaging protein)
MQVTKGALAGLLGVSAGHIGRLVAMGMPGAVAAGGGRGKPALYDAAACLSWQRERQQADAIAAAGDPAARTIRDEYLAALRDKVRLDVAARRGELHEHAECLRATADIAIAVRNKLRGIPAAVCEIVAAEVRPATVHKLLLEAIDGALLELARLPGAAGEGGGGDA